MITKRYDVAILQNGTKNDQLCWRCKEKIKEIIRIPYHPYRILMIGGSGSGKTNSLFNVINQQPDIDKICLYVKDPYEGKYQFLINKRESTGLTHFKWL